MRRRILVLSSSTGSGHDMRAIAFKKWMNQIHGDTVEVRIEQIIENGSLLGRFGVWVYNTIHRNAPFLHNLYFYIVEFFIRTHGESVSFGGRYYRRLLKEFMPDIILSVHDSTNQGYFQDAKRILGKSVRCVTYCGEFSGGFGYTRNWINPVSDLFIARTRPARDYAVSRGIPTRKTAVFHKLLPPECFESRIPRESRGSHLHQLGLDEKLFTLFLATGGYGANHHVRFLNAILPLAGQIQAIVICGRNQTVFNRLNTWKSRHPQLRCYIEGYSNKVAEFIQISDAIVTRGGANTTMEALHFGCPILYNSLGGLMPQEKCTVRYFHERGAAVLIRSPRALHDTVDAWKDFGVDYREIRNNLEKLHYDEDPRQFLSMVLDAGRPAST